MENTTRATEPSTTSSAQDQPFAPGAVVVYGFHGKCQVAGIENRTISGRDVPFYRLEVQKSPLSRSSRPEPAIWLPVNTAGTQGLRTPMDRVQAEQALAILESREYYFPLSESWSTLQSKLESCLRAEGHLGLAKVYGFLQVLKKRQIVLSTEVSRFYENVSRLFMRELSEALNEPYRSLEVRITKLLRNKLHPDH